VRRILPVAAAAIALLAFAPAAVAPLSRAPAPAEARPAVEAAARGLRAWRPRTAAARAYARTRSGIVAFSVRTAHRRAGLREHARFSSASVVKAMLLVAYVRQPSVRRRALSGAERSMLAPMIHWSSNDDASRVSVALGALALPALARRAGMRHFSDGGPVWGASQITAADQTRFFLRLDRLLPRRHRAYALGLLRGIVPSQRWGVARVTPRGWRLHFKGGWTSAVEHQVALLTRGRERVAVAVLTAGSPGAAYARATQEGVFRRLLRGLEGELRGRWRRGP